MTQCTWQCHSHPLPHTRGPTLSICPPAVRRHINAFDKDYGLFFRAYMRIVPAIRVDPATRDVAFRVCFHDRHHLADFVNHPQNTYTLHPLPCRQPCLFMYMLKPCKLLIVC